MSMNVRINFLQWSLMALPFVSVGQPRQLITSARPTDDRATSYTATTPEQHQPASVDAPADLDNAEALAQTHTLPLFGERPKTTTQINEEIHFLNDCDRNFGSRTEASDFFAARGWDYVSNGQLDTAAYRFNLAWLLNEHNADAYWGLGVVCYQKNNLPDAIRMLKKGLEVTDTNAVLMSDLATLQIKYYQQKPNPTDLAEAETVLLKAIALNPGVASSYQTLSLLNYLKADYDKAWDYFHQARNLDLSVLDLSYLNDLLAKRPDPKGVFK